MLALLHGVIQPRLDVHHAAAGQRDHRHLARNIVVVLDLNCFDEGAQQTRAAVEPTFTPA
jgi:hypothetical protein